MRIHFIAIGGAVMHNLAIALHKQGHLVSGSDDEIFDPARANLARYSLLPESTGWFPGLVKADIDIVILGMHARGDNPELLRAGELGLRIYSFPEFMYQQTRGKTRVVIGGSHGKTTITAMIMHILRHAGIAHDYLVGSSLPGYETMVSFSPDSRIAVFEGDEYLTSPLDPRPKFHLYKPHIALLSGIAWDHMNVFPTWEMYKEQFRIFASMIREGGSLIYYGDDEVLNDIAANLRTDIELIPYTEFDSSVENGDTFLINGKQSVRISVFGRHNLQNIAGAWEVCRKLGVGKEVFLDAIKSFKGAGKRLEKVYSDDKRTVYRDFAHAPSKVKATVTAVKEQYPGRKLYACLELHTFSSLNKAFLPQYGESLDNADEAVVFFDPEVVKHKKLLEIRNEDIFKAFKREDLIVFSDIKDLQSWYEKVISQDGIVLMMSSGDFKGSSLKP